MENDGLRLDFPVLDVDLVSGEDDGDVFANANEISMPVRDILVGDSRRHVEKEDGGLGADEVAVAEGAELLLAGCVPHVEAETITNKIL